MFNNSKVDSFGGSLSLLTGELILHCRLGGGADRQTQTEIQTVSPFVLFFWGLESLEKGEFSSV